MAHRFADSRADVGAAEDKERFAFSQVHLVPAESKQGWIQRGALGEQCAGAVEATRFEGYQHGEEAIAVSALRYRGQEVRDLGQERDAEWRYLHRLSGRAREDECRVAVQTVTGAAGDAHLGQIREWDLKLVSAVVRASAQEQPILLDLEGAHRVSGGALSKDDRVTPIHRLPHRAGASGR
jgi:hypothetical protein